MHYTKYGTILLCLTVCKSLSAQVPVREEPHHKPVLENKYVRLLDVHINQGDTTLYHLHAAASVIVHISKSMIGSQVMGQPVQPPAEVLAGQTRFAPYNENPVKHRVYNGGDNIFHVMDIELVKKIPSQDSCAILKSSAVNVETTIDEKLVRVYKFDLQHQQTIMLPASSCAHLLVCISGEVTSNAKQITTGQYIFFDPNTKLSVKDTQADIATCVVLELK
jgi:hypothetical protein